MTTDVERLVKRLRQHALPDPYDERPVMYADLFTEAADNIERLHNAKKNGSHVILTKEEHQNLINIKSLAVEAHKRFVDYDMAADCDVPHEHRDFMRRLKMHLKI